MAEINFTPGLGFQDPVFTTGPDYSYSVDGAVYYVAVFSGHTRLYRLSFPNGRKSITPWGWELIALFKPKSVNQKSSI